MQKPFILISRPHSFPKNSMWWSIYCYFLYYETTCEVKYERIKMMILISLHIKILLNLNAWCKLGSYNLQSSKIKRKYNVTERYKKTNAFCRIQILHYMLCIYVSKKKERNERRERWSMFNVFWWMMRQSLTYGHNAL